MERDFRMLIDGELVEGATTFDVVNPATGTSFAHCPKADRAMIDCDPSGEQAWTSRNPWFQ